MTAKQMALSAGLVAVVGGGALMATPRDTAPAADSAVVGVADTAYRELFELSLAEKKGLTLYVGGHTIPGVVTKILGSEAVELRNPQFSKIVVRCEDIVAVALH